MGALTFLWLAAATTVFVAANAVLKVYATKGQLPVLIGALALFWPEGDIDHGDIQERKQPDPGEHRGPAGMAYMPSCSLRAAMMPR